MKSYNNLFEKVISLDNIKTAILRASARKRDRADVAKILNNVDQEALRIQKLLMSESYVPGHNAECIINDGTNKKVRTIRKPNFAYDQIIHHAIIQILQPIFLKGMYEYVCGSVPKRGVHSGKKAIERWMQKDKRGTKYALKMDIRHFYQSIDTDILKKKLTHKIRDETMLNLLFKVIDSCDQGLPLGYYTSQWLANFLLQDLDHTIKEKYHAKYYIRYMDDMVILGSNKKELHKLQHLIEEYLNRELHLNMKSNWQVFRLPYVDKNEKERGRSLDFMGFQFCHRKVILRKNSMLAMIRKAGKIAKKEKPTWYDATSMLSHMGKLKRTDTRGMYEKYIKPFVDVSKLKKLVSKHQRRLNQIVKSDMEKKHRLYAGCTAGS